MTPSVDHIFLPLNDNVFNLFNSIFDPNPSKIKFIQFHGLHHRYLFRPTLQPGFQNENPTQATQMEKTEKVMAMKTPSVNKHEHTKYVLHYTISSHCSS